MNWLRFFWLCLTRPLQVVFAIFLVVALTEAAFELDRRGRRRVVRGDGFTMRDP